MDFFYKIKRENNKYVITNKNEIKNIFIDKEIINTYLDSNIKKKKINNELNELNEIILNNNSYNFSKLLDLAFTSIIAYSNKPLKLFVKLGVLISLFSFVIAAYYIIKAINGGVAVPGYASLIVSLFFLSGIIICGFGLGSFIFGFISTNLINPENK